MAMMSQLRSQVESILLVVDSPVQAEALATALDVDVEHMAALLEEIANDFHERGSGIELRHSSEGWRLYTLKENAAAVEKFLLEGAHSKLSRAALETLAVIAYRQPCTRAQVAAVRGVNVDGVMRTLTLRGLIKEVEHEGQALFYETTDLLLEQLGIDSLESLPDLAPLLPEVDQILEEL